MNIEALQPVLNVPSLWPLALATAVNANLAPNTSTCKCFLRWLPSLCFAKGQTEEESSKTLPLTKEQSRGLNSPSQPLVWVPLGCLLFTSMQSSSYISELLFITMARYYILCPLPSQQSPRFYVVQFEVQN